jgi:hydroxybutyrate-dimer hydrolase
VDIVNDRDPAGPRRNGASASPSTGRQDYNLDGAACLRDMVVGDSPEARRVQAGIGEFLANGDLRGRAAIILHGRSDDRAPAAFSARPYLALNSLAEGDGSRLRYLEVANAEHFQLSGSGFDTRFVPLFLYHLRALDAMWAHPPARRCRTVRSYEPRRAAASQAGPRRCRRRTCRPCPRGRPRTAGSRCARAGSSSPTDPRARRP